MEGILVSAPIAQLSRLSLVAGRSIVPESERTLGLKNRMLMRLH
jgi:hypothetical protein